MTPKTDFRSPGHFRTSHYAQCGSGHDRPMTACEAGFEPHEENDKWCKWRGFGLECHRPPAETNFEKWKRGLTVENLAELVDCAILCELCPLYNYKCNGATSCFEDVTQWANQLAGTEGE